MTSSSAVQRKGARSLSLSPERAATRTRSRSRSPRGVVVARCHRKEEISSHPCVATPTSGEPGDRERATPGEALISGSTCPEASSGVASSTAVSPSNHDVTSAREELNVRAPERATSDGDQPATSDASWFMANHKAARPKHDRFSALLGDRGESALSRCVPTLIGRRLLSRRGRARVSLPARLVRRPPLNVCRIRDDR